MRSWRALIMQDHYEVLDVGRLLRLKKSSGLSSAGAAFHPDVFTSVTLLRQRIESAFAESLALMNVE